MVAALVPCCAARPHPARPTACRTAAAPPQTPLARACRVALSAAAAALLTLGAPSPCPALTEESLLFLEAWRAVDRSYLDKTFHGQTWFRVREQALAKTPLTTREETYAAIRAMLATLGDPFTRLLEPSRYDALTDSAAGAVTGVGLEITYDASGRVVVVAPAPGGPAAAAGVAPRDELLAVGGVPVFGRPLFEVAAMMRGETGTAVRLDLVTAGGRERVVALTRATVPQAAVASVACGPAGTQGRLGYIRVPGFNANTAAGVSAATGGLDKAGVSAMVMDLRDNGGGSFPAAIDVARQLLPPGKTVVFISDAAGVRDVFDSRPAGGVGPPQTTTPLVVLVNAGTASAAEVLTGALQDNGRSTVLGDTPTFGKGRIQSLFQLSDGSGLAVTVAGYQTPSGRDIHLRGIAPNGPLPAPGLPTTPAAFCDAAMADGGKIAAVLLAAAEAPPPAAKSSGFADE